jgi:hypothetical protein
VEVTNDKPVGSPVRVSLLPRERDVERALRRHAGVRQVALTGLAGTPGAKA